MAHIEGVVAADDLLVAVCDNVHEELPSEPLSRLHWSVPDPVRVGTDAAFERAYVQIEDRVGRLAAAVHQ